MRYDQAGVDIARADSTLGSLKDTIRSTFTRDVRSDVGHFAGLVAVPGAGPGTPLLAASTDGVGTKLLIARDTGREREAAGDLVRHCTNDILVMGAFPLFFLDYFATGALEPRVLVACVEGIAAACRVDGIALLGGETAEMPDLYAAGDFDLAGTIVGTVPAERVIDGAKIRPGDALWALPSEGLHTNGYSLARKIVAARGLEWADELKETGRSIADALLAPHRSYLAALKPLIEGNLVSGLAHVTGGGIAGNLVRVLPLGTRAAIERASFEWPQVFRALADLGDVEREEMEKVFNLGVGMILVLSPAHEADALALLRAGGERPFRIGQIEPHAAGTREAKLS